MGKGKPRMRRAPKRSSAHGARGSTAAPSRVDTLRARWMRLSFQLRDVTPDVWCPTGCTMSWVHLRDTLQFSHGAHDQSWRF